MIAPVVDAASSGSAGGIVGIGAPAKVRVAEEDVRGLASELEPARVTSDSAGYEVNSRPTLVDPVKVAMSTSR